MEINRLNMLHVVKDEYGEAEDRVELQRRGLETGGTPKFCCCGIGSVEFPSSLTRVAD